MTRNEKRQYLSRYRFIDVEIKRLMEERDEWFARATRVTASYGGEARHKSSEGDRLGDIVAKLCELDKMIDERVDALVDLRLELEAHIEKLEDPLLRNLLALRYINGLTFEDIGERLFYSVRQVSNLHEKALDMFSLCEEKEIRVLTVKAV
ncbi:MAG: hypothetical protein GX942_01920 [Papillibacter sp.]|nr:hypothetical protein [Papillibacter sp.]